MRIIATLLICFFCLHTGLAGDPEKKTLKKARKELSKGNYNKAKEYYHQLLELNPDHSDYLFETGLTYYNSGVDKEQSIEYLEKSLLYAGQDTIAEALYYLGRAHHYNQNFEEAVEYYNLFKDYLKENNEGLVLSRDVDRFIEMVNNGIKAYNTTDRDVTIINVGTGVNTKGSEYAPVVKGDRSYMIYTARREGSTGGKFYHDNQEYEDIFVSTYSNNEESWSNSTRIDSSNTYISRDINSKKHDAAISFNKTENKLYIYRKNHVWVSELKDGKWKAPVKMNKNINSSGHEPSAFLTADEKTIYIVSTDRKGGKGGRDIWVAHENEDGNWGELKQVRGKINTEFDEDAPFLTPDGKTMYFSSNGHQTMGGYDVFKSELQPNGSWGEPINLGAPINSAGDDIYYAFGSDSTVAYYSSSREGGFGNMDIYFIELDCKTIPQTEIKGLLLAGDKQFPVGAEIIIFDKDGKEVTRTQSDPVTGGYFLVLKPEQTYKMEVKANDPWFVKQNHKQEFTIPKQCDPYPLYQEVAINRLKTDKGVEYAQEALFQNAFFNVEDSVRTLYNIPGTTSGIKEMPIDSLQYNLAGNLRFNEVVNVGEDAKVYLINSMNEIVRITQTNKRGDFVFRNLNPQEDYMVALDAEDLKFQYYGNNSDNGLIVKGKLERAYPGSEIAGTVLDSMTLYFVDDKKNIVNKTLSDSTGIFVLDNLPEEPVEKHQPFVYSIDNKELDYAVSALIHTIDADNNEINYTEVIDIIELDTTSEIEIPLTREFENIYFDFDKYFLRQRSKQILDDIYSFMAANPSVQIKMAGHTDWMGTDVYNEVLGKNRSQSAFEYLIAKGIDAERISTESYGETRPVVPNANPDGTDNPDNRQLNRRVEFKINTSEMAYTFSM